MRLINAETRQLKEFFDEELPEYAVLSHTWGDISEEVSLRDYAAGMTEKKPGMRKIELALQQTRRDRLQWLWVDTCCIDRSSSADLSEAVNAAWRWFAESAACYVYLSDCSATNDPGSKDFLRARWFTRSWTLPELLAPRSITFFAENWTQIGVGSMQTDLGVLESVYHVTKIPRDVLTGTLRPWDFCISQRMSWASRRMCSRVEDLAYSLFGLFEVNLPVMYGEGRRAFIRLQEHIFHQHPDDDTVLAWCVGELSQRTLNIGGLWAESPADFAESGSIRPVERAKEPLKLTAEGMLLDLRPPVEIKYRETLHLYCDDKPFHELIVCLNCGDDKGRRVMLPIALAEGPAERNKPRAYCRIMTRGLDLRPSSSFSHVIGSVPKKFCLRGKLSLEDRRFAAGGIHIQHVPPADIGSDRQTSSTSLLDYRVTDAIVYGSWARWSAHYHCFQLTTPASRGSLTQPAVLTVESRSHQAQQPGFSVVVGLTPEMAYCGLSHKVRDPSLADAMEIVERSEATHSFDYRHAVGDLTEDRLQVGGTIITVKLHKETLGGTAHGKEEDRGHYLVLFTFEKTETRTSLSRRFSRG
ncbi:hypothetical protein NKR23_g10575 [Pleurostoma richardsiae]|uniref:Heterokaryon incompatibility domain-containing protein n=1 Tax=Pleurostoma richardsiae TaxID=41990 RepID=A0AA38RJT4_9PEZI|nr:hypothetical protein NKR23_g10575 [Pleurostoma richardsiae]